MPRAVSYRFPLYALVNVVFVLLVGVASAAGGFPNPRLIYLILLFALCSTTVIDLDGLNGRFMLLALFMVVYFVSFGMGDLSNLLNLNEPYLPELRSLQPVSGLLSRTEDVILAGGAMLVLGYRITVFMVTPGSSARAPRDWPKPTILILGLIFWAVGTIATYRWNIYIIPDTTNEAYRKGLASISPATTTAYLLGQMCQPLGVLLLAYAWSVFRNSYLTALIIAMVTLQIFIGFVIDVKSLAMLGIILVVITSVLVDGKLPKVGLAAGLMFV